MDKKVMLDICGLRKLYGDKLILDNLSLRVEQGDIYGFLGPNGSGKTTTIRSILGLVHFQEGTVILNGINIKKDFKKAIIKVGAVVETPRFYENYSGYWNLKVMADFYDDIPQKRICEVLDMVGLGKRAKEKVRTYSLGMKQRLGIARALLPSPELVILDEPTNGLDPQGMKEVREMISQLAIEQNITFFISTHLLSEVEVLCHKVGILKEGRKIAEGKVSTLLKKDSEVLDIYTPRTAEAMKTLKDLNFILDRSFFTKGIRVEIPRGFSERIIKLLVEQNIPIQYVTPKNQSLEDYFIELTKGGDQIA